MSKYKLPDELEEMIRPELSRLAKASIILGDADCLLWQTLNLLFHKFRRYAQTTLLQNWDYRAEFRNYLEQEWGIGQTQQYQYLRVARHQGLANAKISCSRAIILAGYDNHIVIAFRQMFGDEKISTWSCRELKSAIERQPAVIALKVANRGIKKGRGQSLQGLDSKSEPPNLKLFPTKKTDANCKPSITRAEDLPTLMDAVSRFQEAFSQVKRAFRRMDLSQELQEMISDILSWKEEKSRTAEEDSAETLESA